MWAKPDVSLFLVVFSYLVNINEATELKFLSEPSSRLVKLSDGKAVFRCEVSPSSADIRWLWRGQPIQPSRWLRMSKHKLTVHLHKMDRQLASENGGFQCEARMKNKVLVSAPAELIIAVLQPFPVQKDLYISAVKGSTALIPCQPPHSVPTVITEFSFNNETIIEKSSSRYLIMPSGSLQILNVDSTDSGEYICIANNPYLAEKCQAQHKVFLNITETLKSVPPRFLVVPFSKTVTVLGSNVTLECAASGHPIPSIKWRKLNGHLPHSRHQFLAGNLVLFGVHRKDEGSYECMAENSLGSRISKTTMLEIHETPFIVKLPRDIYVEMEKDVHLQCNTRGHPKPVITWFHNGKVMELEQKQKDSELVLRNVSQKQAGIYQCFARNQLGSVYSTCYVHVLHGNRTMDQDYDAEDYDDYDDEEDSLSIPKHHHWKGSHVIHKNHYDGHDSEDEIELNGKDVSRKKHRKKKKHKGVKLVPPTKPEVTRLSDNSVMVRWGVPRNDGLPILFFKVQYKEIGRNNTEWMTIDEDIAAHIHSYAVTDLRNGGKYRFRIAAAYSNNDNKLSPNSSKFVLYKDPPTRKPGAGPVITQAKAISPSAITLLWEYKDVESVPIEGFFIYYRATHNAGDYLKVTVLGANTRSHIISHLFSETSYDIKTQCFNSAGTSDFSNIFTCKTKPSKNIEIRSRNSKAHLQDEEISITKPVSSKDSQGNAVLNIVLGVISSAMIIAITVFAVLYIRQRSTRQQHSDDESHQGTPVKMTNGHVGNGYIPVNRINISINPLSDLDVGKTIQNGVSNNNEIIQLQTFVSDEIPQLQPLLGEGERETTAGEDVDETVILPSNTDAIAEVPRSI